MQGKKIEGSKPVVNKKSNSKDVSITSKAKRSNLLLKKSESICTVPWIWDIYSPNISKDIKNAFFSIVKQPISINEVPKGFMGDLRYYNFPFQNSVHGAYIIKTQWEMLQFKIANHKSKDGHFKNFTPKNVSSGLKQYAKGFQYGYDNFLKNKISSEITLSQSDSDKPQKVIDFLDRHLFLPGAFSESHGLGVSIFSNWYNEGIECGYFYAAWCVVFENHKLFNSFFKERISTGVATMLWKDIIKTELHERLQEIENKIKPNLERWAQRENLIECAAFCSLLFQKKYFIAGATNIKSVNSFALSKYGADITIQLKTAKNKDRMVHEKRLSRLF